ncbi:MAG: hypothetical protein E6J52_03180 [Chloroflexi bacterium]|nr:MAG: hypothetical protein E6J52_03180 [Chloroflexota bacterium]
MLVSQIAIRERPGVATTIAAALPSRRSAHASGTKLTRVVGAPIAPDGEIGRATSVVAPEAAVPATTRVVPVARQPAAVEKIAWFGSVMGLGVAAGDAAAIDGVVVGTAGVTVAVGAAVTEIDGEAEGLVKGALALEHADNRNATIAVRARPMRRAYRELRV